MYVGYYTAAQIAAKITAIESAYETVLSGGRSYRLNDSHGDIQVTRETLPNLQSQLDYWLSKYDELDQGSGIVSFEVSR